MAYTKPISPRILLSNKLILDKWEAHFYEHKTPCDPYCFEKGTRDKMFKDADWLRWHDWMQLNYEVFPIDESKAKERIMIFEQMIDFEKHRLAIKKEVIRIFDKNPNFNYVEIFNRK